MKLESDGILIGMRPIGERDSVATIFTAEYGLMRGLLRGAQVTKKNRPLVGQIGATTWNARLDTQLGTFHWESTKNPTAAIMLNPRALACMNAAFELIGALLPERENFASLYSHTLILLDALATTRDADTTYLIWEIELLRDSGYALDMTRCSGCGTTNDLQYLSPRTGRAVCAACGAPYAARLYRLPITLCTTLNFIRAACTQQGITVPQAREFLGIMRN